MSERDGRASLAAPLQGLQIAEVSVKPIHMNTRGGGFILSSGTVKTSEALLVRIVDNEGMTGSGIGPIGAPFISGETAIGAASFLKDVIGPLLIGQNPADRWSLMWGLRGYLGSNSRAISGIDIALWDWIARRLNVPVVNLLGATSLERIQVLRLLPLGTEKEVTQAAKRLSTDGFDCFKVKLGRGEQQDVEVIEGLRRALPDVTLTADFNGYYSPRRAVRVLSMLAEFDLMYAEQPVKRGDRRAEAWVKDRSGIPILADESANSIEDVVNLAQNHACDAISIKIGKFGGLTGALAAITVCESLGLEWIVGTTPAGQLIDAVSGHLICARSSGRVIGEVGEFVRVDSDPYSGLRCEDGTLVLPDGPGFGVIADSDLSYD